MLAEGLSFLELILVDGDILFEEGDFFLEENSLLSGLFSLISELIHMEMKKFVLVNFGLVLNINFSDVVVGLLIGLNISGVGERFGD